MKLLPWLMANPDAVLAFIGAIGSLVGAGKVRRGRELAAKAEAAIDRWAYAAAEAIVKVAEATGDHDAGSLATKGLAFFRKMARAAGVEVTDAQEARARAVIVEALNRLGERLDPAARARLGGAAREILRDLDRWQNLDPGPPAHGHAIDLTVRK